MSLRRRRAIGWVLCAGVAAGAPTAHGQATPPVRPPTAGGAGGAAAAKAKASLEPLLQQGADALAAGQYQAAREAFLDAIHIDPRNAKAHHGVALCLMAQKETAKAAQVFDKVFTLTTAPDRATVLNAAACHMATKANMRAAKVIKDYLARAKDLDEPMLNALGTALSAATSNERKNRFFSECEAFYLTVNRKFEEAKPGFKRFGAEWLTARDADAKNAAIAAQRRQLDSLSEAIATAEERLETATKEFDRQKFLLTRGEPPNNYYYVQAQTTYDRAKENLQAAQERYETLASTLPRPAFPPEIQVVAIDNVTAPPVSTPVATVASADPLGSGATTTTPKPKPVKPKPPKPADTDTPTPTKVPEPAAPPVALEPPRSTRKVRITQYAAAFPVAADLVVTSAATLEEGATLQLQASDGQSLSAELVRKDPASGLALLKVSGRKLIPLAVADTFAGGPVSCASFPAVDLFSPAAQAITGSAQAPKEGWTVSLNVHPRLGGAPVLSGGKVVGVCVAPRDAERGKLPAVPLDALKAFLGGDVQPPAKAAGDAQAALLQLVTTRESGGGAE